MRVELTVDGHRVDISQGPIPFRSVRKIGMGVEGCHESRCALEEYPRRGVVGEVEE